MTEKKLGVICAKDNDLLEVLKNACPALEIFKPDELTEEGLDRCGAFAVLGGAAGTPLVFPARMRLLIEKQIAAGKKVFSEFCGSIGDVYCQEPSLTRVDRLVCTESLPGLTPGDILDDQCGTRVKPWFSRSNIKPLLQYVRENTHEHMTVTEETYKNVYERGLWLEKDNLLLCSFRISNFNRSRFSPRDRWLSVVRYIVEWLLGQPAGETLFDGLEKPYELLTADPKSIEFEKRLYTCIDKGINWFKNAGILIHNGKDGVKEGMATEIDADGNQRMLTGVRDDCSGETALPYFLNYLLRNRAEDLAVSDNLLDFCFDCFQIKDKGLFEGMTRWTDTGWGVCYQDDVARAILPQLFKCLILKNDTHLPDCARALNFLVRTTGTDGMRKSRTDNVDLTPQEVERLHSTPGNFPSTHYNGYYWAALLLANKLTGIAEYKNVAVRGLEALMAVYPNTRREHSQTQELCRMILPLAYLYWVTGEEKHKAWLYQVASDLQPMRHRSGAYIEWDEGYKAHRYSVNGGECSLLTKNGDPVVDMLYSLNWLPSAFIQAYFITGDSYFKDLWKGIAGFMVSAQIHSANKQIDGGWTRALDVKRMEVFALPNDIGWGPWAMESGWTVAEICSGLMMGLLEDKLKGYFKK